MNIYRMYVKNFKLFINIKQEEEINVGEQYKIIQINILWMYVHYIHLL